MADYTPPDEVYGFPPLFTLQEVTATRQKQCEMWHGILLAYARAKKAWDIGVQDAIFTNKAINRTLERSGARVVLGSLVSAGKAAFKKNSDDQCWVLTRPLEDWAADVYQKAVNDAALGTVMTIFELTDDEAAGQSWEGMPSEMFYLVLEALQRQGKAEIIYMGGDGDGVKFL
eukprot:TRINITY_DN9155_c0_g1_i1.p2 TRINITY_DN9155_c0_g1~~TRINITY_DN9155_c0_g1_i1.p2  ORF type:complete len:173 (+),score=79.62 TRINITY_DN9155_c0_g1_i1:1056-1574(+)